MEAITVTHGSEAPAWFTVTMIVAGLCSWPVIIAAVVWACYKADQDRQREVERMQGGHNGQNRGLDS